jgi:putative FmdB family regulatory protein
MPTYEYQCPEGHVFEKFQKMSDKPRTKCAVCGKRATRKISGGAGLVFKGTGFYITDYGKDGKGPRKEGAEKADQAEKPAAPSEGSKSPGGNEGKTEKPTKAGPAHGKGKAASE